MSARTSTAAPIRRMPSRPRRVHFRVCAATRHAPSKSATVRCRRSGPKPVREDGSVRSVIYPEVVSEFPGLAHVAVTVTDLERSTRWYNTLFDSTPVLDEDEETGGFQ